MFIEMSYYFAMEMYKYSLYDARKYIRQLA